MFPRIFALFNRDSRLFRIIVNLLFWGAFGAVAIAYYTYDTPSAWNKPVPAKVMGGYVDLKLITFQVFGGLLLLAFLALLIVKTRGTTEVSRAIHLTRRIADEVASVIVNLASLCLVTGWIVGDASNMLASVPLYLVGAWLMDHPHHAKPAPIT
ncbi:hypothetical protein PAQ31011_00803 [Pandoraea aquatica]|uniref:Uncharacterized protein n=1 Tax=Pandoraea aquatica TaxID=2508290 RepID=A0A5E4SG88_9BURK|nr:hypothetical protein [Pandoraea aquatica]VVD74670.1 hypothetical protein PAQ31011_00803 [Pandoraea aquatica]